MLITSQSRVKLPQIVSIFLGVRIWVSQLESLLIIEALLHELGLILGLQKITWHLVCAIITTGNVMVGKWVIELRVVHEIDATDSWTNPINVLPGSLFL